MNYTFSTFVGNGTQTVFPFGFAGEDTGYISTSDIHVYVNNLEVPFTIDRANPNQVVLTTAPASGTGGVIRRIMPDTRTYADYSRGNIFNEDTLNNSFRQQLYLTQELLDGYLPEGFYMKQNVDMGGHILENLGVGTKGGDSVNWDQWENHEERIDALENDLTGISSKTIPYYYIATGGETRWQVPARTFDSALLYINGIFQNQNLGAFSISSNGFNFPEPLQQGDEVYALIGSTPATGSMTPAQDVEVVQPTGLGVRSNQAIKNMESISVKDFGAKGDSVTDDTQAIKAADAYCSANGLNLFFPRGVYIITSSIDSYCDWYGVGAPRIGTFPLADDKQFLVAGSRYKITGSTILVKSASSVFTTLRSDGFGSFTYAVKKVGRTSARSTCLIKDMGIVLNFDYKDASGNVTTPANDNRVNVDVTLLLHNIEQGKPINVCVGGYAKKGGIVHFGVDPDNTTLTNVSTMGDYGLAVIGDTTGTNSGLNLVSCFVGSNDHHSRSVDPSNELWGTSALYIDIPSSTGAGSRNGISMIGGTITTKTRYPIKLDRCGAINFTNVVFENASQAGSVIAGVPKQFIGTTNTGDIGFSSCRLNAEQIRNTGALLDTAPNAMITIIGGNSGFGIQQWRGHSGIQLSTTATQQTVQLTDDPTTTTSGIRMRRSSGGVMEFAVDNIRVLEMSNLGITYSKYRKTVSSIVSNAVTLNSPMASLSGGTVDLVNITGTDGLNRVTLMANTSTDIITLKNMTGNLRIGADYVLSGFKCIDLVYNGTFWILVD